MAAGTHDRTSGGLGSQAFWFAAHSALAVSMVIAIAGAGLFLKISQTPREPKLIGTLLAFTLPLALAFVVAKLQKNPAAQHVWVAGLLFFVSVSVWVLELPAANSLCEYCGPAEKLWRTFFAIDHASGLLGGDGLLVGAWIPLSLLGYAMGAKAALATTPQAEPSLSLL